MSAKRHVAGVATYPGNKGRMLGEVKGPLTYGGLVVAVETDYTTAADRTRVTFAHLTADDTYTTDEFGIRRLDT